MKNIVKKLINELAWTEATIESMQIDNWFQNLNLTYHNNETEVRISFLDCSKMNLSDFFQEYRVPNKHNADRPYDYFNHTLEIKDYTSKNGEKLYRVTLVATPFEAEIICRAIRVCTDSYTELLETEI